jgi:Flp pilus assembly protein TadD
LGYSYVMNSGKRSLLAGIFAAVVTSTACQKAPPTFNRDIAPIVFKNCTPCHRTGQQAVPFTLLSYADAQKRADIIAKVTLERRMPPWPPDSVTPEFMARRGLTSEQIDLIQRWVQGGAPEGELATRPSPPQFKDGWESGKPDVVVTMKQPYMLEPRGEMHHDVFRNVVMRVPIETTKYVKTVEFLPGLAPVHHAVIRIDRTGESLRGDGKDGKPGFDGMTSVDVQSPDGHFIGWAPGRGPIVAPQGMPWRLDPGTDLVIELHLLPGSEPTPVEPQVGLFLTDEPPAHTPVMLIMGSRAIDIPAGDKEYAITDSYTVPGDVDLLSLYPHAHYLGKDMRVDAKLPDGTSRTLLHIAKWDFHWQQDYRYSSPVFLPRGTTIAMRFTFDNSNENPQNPHHPPIHVTFGGQSSDEMGNLGVQLLPRVSSDAAIMTRDFARKDALANVEGDEVLTKYDPNNAYRQMTMGRSYLYAGRFDDAIARLELSSQLDPKSAQTLNFLAAALFAKRSVPDAITRMRQATVLDPKDEHLQFNLGRMLNATGQFAEAQRALERALALNPKLAEAHQELGAVLFAQNRLDAALPHLFKAVELSPDSAGAQSDLGGALAQAGRTREAAEHLRRALAIDPANDAARQNLAILERAPLR